MIAVYISIILLGMCCITQRPIAVHAAAGTISVKVDYIYWVIQEFNGKKYKRLYNSATGEWLTDWILLD